MPFSTPLTQSQTERTARAQSAIHAGKFQITRVAPQRWLVKNHDTAQNGRSMPYTVSFERNGWACTCADYQQHGPQIRCKHIEGVRFAEATIEQLTHINHKEHSMDASAQSTDGDPPERLDPTRQELRQPANSTTQKYLQTAGIDLIPSLEGSEMINRANTIFNFAWSFELTGEPVIHRWQKKILGWNQQERRKAPIRDVNGQFLVEEVGMVWITGMITVDLGGRQYSHADLGRCSFTGDSAEALDTALANCVTDCLKRCFRQLGEQFGNSLYDKDITPAAHRTQPRLSTPTHPVRRYGDGSNVNGNVSEQEAFDAYLSKFNKAPDSKDRLRSWLVEQYSPQASPTTS